MKKRCPDSSSPFLLWEVSVVRVGEDFQFQTAGKQFMVRVYDDITHREGCQRVEMFIGRTGGVTDVRASVVGGARWVCRMAV